MNLRNVDLNLLVVLHTLLEERHVTRAAKRLHLSQPATSSALERCRQLFADPLLVRSKNHMRLTAKAQQLQDPIKILLEQAQTVLASPSPALQDIEQNVTILMTDALLSTMFAQLHQCLNATAPNINLIVKNWQGSKFANDQLSKGELDIVFSGFQPWDAFVESMLLTHLSHQVVMRKAHPIAQHFDLQSWLHWPHIMVSGEGGSSGRIDKHLAEMGKKRRVGLVVPYFQIVPSLLLSSDYLAILPNIVVPQVNQDKFVMHPPPLPLEAFALYLSWHTRNHDQVAVQHVVHIIKQLFTEYTNPSISRETCVV